jgi:ABC-type sugar transport system ATPase subunit
MTEITLENVSKYFGKVKAVENLNLKIRNKEFMVLLGPSGLTVRAGEFFSILGPSGCGKTTTLRIIAGLESPTSGSLAFDGKDVTDLEPKKRNVAMVFQDYALYPHMSVYDNITLALKVKKVHREEIMERAKRTAEMLGIEELLHRKPSELSGGQKQRVALARAIIRDPSVYLFDEPLSNIDAILRVRMRAELKKLHERLGTTTVTLRTTKWRPWCSPIGSR